jgi:enamine deaminase RidA (YjgF/YER057c/UK114 family)
MKVDYINPENMSKPRGYSHAIAVSGDRKTIYIGGQNALDADGNVVGKGNLKEQTAQVLENIGKILNKAGAKLENVVKFNIHILQGQNPQEGFGVFQEKWGASPNLPTITVLFVAGLGNPDWLLEIDAVAEVPA